ncbi:MAG: DUF4388 domain-containing protein [Acidobacteriota bacterium]
MFILSGSLTDLPLPNLLQTIGSGHKTGRLVLTRRDGHAVIVFRDGKIILAATNGARESFGSILVTKRLVNESTLVDALSRQARSPTETRLGAVLVQMGALREEDVEAVLHAQVQKVISELLGWSSGFVKFEALEIPDCGEVSVVADDFVLHEGLSPDIAVLGAMEQGGPRRSDPISGEIRLLSALGLPSGTPAAKAEPPRKASLSSIMAEIRSPAFPGEVSLAILRLAAARLERGVLLQRTSDALRGMGQFGLAGRDPDERIRDIRIPTDEGSIFIEVLERRETYRGPLDRLYWNVEFTRRIGGELPSEVALIPMVVEDRVVMVLYGDNQPSGRPIGDLGDLEALMIEGGLIIEKALLDSRLNDLESRRSSHNPQAP